MSTLKLVGPQPLLRRGVKARTYSPRVIDLSEATWLAPFDVAALAVIWRRLDGDGRRPEIVEPRDPDARRHYYRTGLADLVGGGGSSSDQPLLRLTRLAVAEDWDDMLVDLWPEPHPPLPEPATTLRMIDILSELIDNAGTHGRSDAGTFIAADYFPDASGIWLAVTDGGRGIPAHLRGNPSYADIKNDPELIQLARRPEVTGTADRRGWGLVQVFEQGAEVGPSEVVIRSGHGEGYFRLHPGRRPYARYRQIRPAVPGTWVHVRLEAR